MATYEAGGADDSSLDQLGRGLHLNDPSSKRGSLI